MWRNSNNMPEIHGTGSEKKLTTASLYQIVDVRIVKTDEHHTWYICNFLSVLYSNTNSDLTISLPTKRLIKKTPVLLHQYSCLHQYPWGNLRTRVTGPVSWRVPPSTWEFWRPRSQALCYHRGCLIQKICRVLMNPILLWTWKIFNTIHW